MSVRAVFHEKLIALLTGHFRSTPLVGRGLQKLILGSYLYMIMADMTVEFSALLSISFMGPAACLCDVFAI
jgi:hypothetical protein